MDPTTAAAAGNSIGDLIMGGGIAISGIVVMKILAVVSQFAGQWFSARNQKTQVGPDPLNVKPVPNYVLCEDCIRRHQAVDKRHDELALEIKGDRQALSDQLSGIRTALSENDKKAEERSRNLHKRIDPLVASIADSKGKIDNHLEDHRHLNNGGQPK